MRATRVAAWALPLLLSGAARSEDVGITLPPLVIGLDVSASAEGEAPFLDVARRVAQAVDHPTDLELYRHGDELVRDLEQGHLAFAVLSCRSMDSLSTSFRSRSRVLAALVLGGLRSYKGVLLRAKERLPETPRGTVALPSAESAVGRSRELERRRLRPRFMRSSQEALERTLAGEAEFVAVSDVALREARAQGFGVDALEEVAGLDELPFEGFLVGPAVPVRHDARIRTVLLSAKARSPGKVSVEWRVVDQAGWGRECAR